MSMFRKASIVVLIASVTVGLVAAWTASAGQEKVAVCHFTGNPEVFPGPDFDGDLVPDWVDFIYEGQVIEVADAASVNLALQGDEIVPLEFENQVVKGDFCQKQERLNPQGNRLFGHVFVLGNGGANVVQFDCP